MLSLSIERRERLRGDDELGFPFGPRSDEKWGTMIRDMKKKEKEEMTKKKKEKQEGARN